MVHLKQYQTLLKPDYLVIAFYPHYIIILIYIFFYIIHFFDPLIYYLNSTPGDVSSFTYSLIDFLIILGSIIFVLIPPTVYIIAVSFAIRILTTSLFDSYRSQELLRINMLIKLCHAPCSLIIFYIGINYSTNPTIAFVCAYLLILSSGIIGLAGLFRVWKERKISFFLMLIFIIDEFLFVLDVPIAILIYFLYRDKPENKLQAPAPQVQQ